MKGDDSMHFSYNPVKKVLKLVNFRSKNQNNIQWSNKM
jgi:hypothetical protein